jgi:hypothetical protein
MNNFNKGLSLSLLISIVVIWELAPFNQDTKTYAQTNGNKLIVEFDVPSNEETPAIHNGEIYLNVYQIVTLMDVPATHHTHIIYQYPSRYESEMGSVEVSDNITTCMEKITAAIN